MVWPMRTESLWRVALVMSCSVMRRATSRGSPALAASVAQRIAYLDALTQDSATLSSLPTRKTLRLIDYIPHLPTDPPLDSQ